MLYMCREKYIIIKIVHINSLYLTLFFFLKSSYLLYHYLLPTHFINLSWKYKYFNFFVMEMERSGRSPSWMALLEWFWYFCFLSPTCIILVTWSKNKVICYYLMADGQQVYSNVIWLIQLLSLIHYVRVDAWLILFDPSHINFESCYKVGIFKFKVWNKFTRASFTTM